MPTLSRPTPPDIGPEVAALKGRLVQLGDPARSYGRALDMIKSEVDKIRQLADRGGSVIPELTYAAIAHEQVTEAQVADIRHRGCVIVRGVFDAAQAIDWNEELGSYLTNNDYLARAEAKAGMDPYFSNLRAQSPQIYGVYWSKPQVLARQAQSMAVTKRFLNGLYDNSAPGGQEFDPTDDYAYADRIRRRTPGDTSFGLAPHMDAGSYERWLDPAYQKIYGSVFAGRFEDFDPWTAAYRTKTREFASPAVCSMFRTFQGWTALTPQGPGDGTLCLVPIANSIVYLLLRALQDDVDPGDLCGATPGRSLAAKPEWHADLLDGLVSIPLLEPGDTIWWQPDLVHSVADHHEGTQESNVIYIAASPRCEKNEVYARRQAIHFSEGRSAPDFAAEDYEIDFEGRATIADLTELGRRQMGL